MNCAFMKIILYRFSFVLYEIISISINYIFFVDDVVPIEIKLMSDKKSVPLYLNLLESGFEEKRDIRLVIVGKKGSGKTSLVKRLFGVDKSEIPEVTSTNGIEIHRIRCDANTDAGIWNILDGKIFKLLTFIILYNRKVLDIYEWNNVPFCC